MLGVFCSIDATHNDGLGRMCNDGQKMPNTVMKKIVTDEVSSCLFALRDIRIGDEIRYDYALDDGNMLLRKQCHDTDQPVQQAKLVIVIDGEQTLPVQQENLVVDDEQTLRTCCDTSCQPVQQGVSE